jgi:hypothetical protein
MTRLHDWTIFSGAVAAHVKNYTVAQYGDKGSDLATEYTVQDCLSQAKKYLARHGRNERPGQDELDLLKMAHYVQMAYTKLKEQQQ